MSNVIEVKDVIMRFGGVTAVDHLNMAIPKGSIVGLIGPNGAGKTTMFKMLVGEEKPDSGELVLGSTVQFGYVDQKRASLTPGKSVYDIISGGNDFIKLGSREVNARAYCSRFNFQGGDQQKKDQGDLQLPCAGPNDKSDVAKGIFPFCHETHLRKPVDSSDGYSILL